MSSETLSKHMLRFHACQRCIFLCVFGFLCVTAYPPIHDNKTQIAAIKSSSVIPDCPAAVCAASGVDGINAPIRNSTPAKSPPAAAPDGIPPAPERFAHSTPAVSDAGTSAMRASIDAYLVGSSSAIQTAQSTSRTMIATASAIQADCAAVIIK